jgi:hypothetical protein
MPEGEVESTIKPQVEADYFPRNGSTELQHLKELVGTQDVTILPLKNVGYIVHNNKLPLIAEAPWVLMDFDDTGAQTTKDKAECKRRLEINGFDSEVIQYCDKRSRVYLGDEEQTYEPELEMRLFAAAGTLKKDGKVFLTPEVKETIEKTRKELLEKKNLEKFQVPSEIQDIYDSTRFTSTLYPDTIDTLKKLRSVNPQLPFPANIGILTYGDPSFQLAKTQQLLKAGVINDILVTRVQKGNYFEELVNENPFKKLSLQYKFPETPRGVGIQFKDWSVMIELFDDDPSQVKNFNGITKKLGLTALGVTRVRRQGIKRAEKDIDTGRFVTEIHTEDSYLDTNLYVAAHAEFQNRVIEDNIVKEAKVRGNLPLHQIRPILAVIAERRGISLQEEMDVLSKKIGENSFTSGFGNPIERPELYQVIADKRK